MINGSYITYTHCAFTCTAKTKLEVDVPCREHLELPLHTHICDSWGNILFNYQSSNQTTSHTNANFVYLAPTILAVYNLIEKDKKNIGKSKIPFAPSRSKKKKENFLSRKFFDF